MNGKMYLKKKKKGRWNTGVEGVDSNPSLTFIHK
jgi:hypothetical protein